jgi:hypothetical protein
MKLHEEFREYETLWENVLAEEKEFRSELTRLKSTPEGREKLKNLSNAERLALINADTAADPVMQALKKKHYSDFEFDYEGWEEEGYEDHFDPDRGHWDTAKTYVHPDFTYTVEPVDMLQVLVEDILSTCDPSKYNSNILNEYKKLEAAWINATPENEEEACEVVELFVIEHLEEFVDMFYSELHEYYRERAYDWEGYRSWY